MHVCMHIYIYTCMCVCVGGWQGRNYSLSFIIPFLLRPATIFLPLSLPRSLARRRLESPPGVGRLFVFLSTPLVEARLLRVIPKSKCR